MKNGSIRIKTRKRGAETYADAAAGCRSRSFSFSMLEVGFHENLIGGR